MKNDDESLSHTKWRCQYHIVITPKHCRQIIYEKERTHRLCERGNENRKLISVNKMLASLQKTVRCIGAWLDDLRKAVSRQRIIESPDDYPLSDVITAYPDMRKDGFRAVSFLSNHHLYTVGQLVQYIAETQRIFSKIKAESAVKERRICDIDALFGAIQTMKELKPIQQEYENIHWNSKHS